MMISKKLELVYIDVPKTASATLDTFFEDNGWELCKHSQGLKHRRIIPSYAKDYTKVASVRNPFDRVTSFYFFKRVKNQFVGSFDSFLDFLLSHKEYAAGYNDLKTYIHFPMCKYLKPTGYDIILRQENLIEDLKQIGFINPSLGKRNKLDRPTWKDVYTKERERKIIIWAEEDFEEFGY